MSIPFYRLKKKSLVLIYLTYPEIKKEILEDIRYKKLYQCILKPSQITFKELTLSEHTKPVWDLVKMNKTLIVSRGGDSIKIWDLISGKCINTITCVDFKEIYGVNPNIVKLSETKIATAYRGANIRIFDITTSTLKCFPEIYYISGIITYLCKLNKSQVICANLDNSVMVYELDPWQCIKTLKRTDRTRRNDWPDNNGITYTISIAILNETQIVCGNTDNTITIWDLSTVSCLKVLKNTYPVKKVIKISKTQIVSASKDKSIKIWDITNGTCLKTIIGHDDQVNTVIMISKTQLVSGSRDNSLKVWDIINGTCLRTLIGHTNTVTNVIMLGKFQIASASCDYSIKIWDL